MVDRTILDLADRLEPGIRAAFLEAVDNITSDADIAAIIEALDRNDIEGALRAVGLIDAQLEPLRRAMVALYLSGGDWFTGQAVRDAARRGIRVAARFQGTNARAEADLALRSSTKVVEIFSDQREDIRGYLTRQMQAGVNTKRVGLDLVGRINKGTGKREGGVIGLHSGQIQWAENAYAELVSGDPAMMRNFLTRKARNKTFDALIRRAIAEGKPLTATQASNIVAKYRAKLLRQRGDSIARTETLPTLHAAQDEALRQMVDAGKVSAGQITRTWDSAEDRATRPSHRALDNQARGLGEVFVSPLTGARMMFPGDAGHGAPASETIQCRCRVVAKIDWIAGLQRGD